jgi:hypothetical protein
MCGCKYVTSTVLASISCSCAEKLQAVGATVDFTLCHRDVRVVVLRRKSVLLRDASGGILDPNIATTASTNHADHQLLC